MKEAVKFPLRNWPIAPYSVIVTTAGVTITILSFASVERKANNCWLLVLVMLSRLKPKLVKEAGEFLKALTIIYAAFPFPIGVFIRLSAGAV